MARIIEETLIANSKEDLDVQVAWYLNQYHPLGYDTRIVRTTHDPKTGKYTATMSRWNSCD